MRSEGRPDPGTDLTNRAPLGGAKNTPSHDFFLIFITCYNLFFEINVKQTIQFLYFSTLLFEPCEGCQSREADRFGPGSQSPLMNNLSSHVNIISILNQICLKKLSTFQFVQSQKNKTSTQQCVILQN